MSSQLATNLTGRYVEIEVLPLSFEEYLSGQSLSDNLNTTKIFNNYLFSAFPYLLQTSSYAEKIDYLRGIYNSILLNDIVTRLEIQILLLLSALSEPFSVVQVA